MPEYNHVVLIGPRCCGKTSVGKELASRLKVPFVDADERFKEIHGSVEDFVNTHKTREEGWREFRKYEAQVLSNLCGEFQSGAVLAPGGGAVAHDQGEQYRQENVRALKSFGRVFYLLPSHDLEVSARVLAERQAKDQASKDQRPSLTGEKDPLKEMLELITRRHPLYLQAATEPPFFTGSLFAHDIALAIISALSR